MEQTTLYSHIKSNEQQEKQGQLSMTSASAFARRRRHVVGDVQPLGALEGAGPVAAPVLAGVVLLQRRPEDRGAALAVQSNHAGRARRQVLAQGSERSQQARGGCQGVGAHEPAPGLPRHKALETAPLHPVIFPGQGPGAPNSAGQRRLVRLKAKGSILELRGVPGAPTGCANEGREVEATLVVATDQTENSLTGFALV